MTNHRQFLTWPRFLACVTIMLVVAGCGDESSRDQPTAISTVAATETPAPSPTATATLASTNPPAPTSTPRDGSVTDIAPPLAVLTTAAGTQEAELGTYCWQEGLQGLCVDATGLPVPETLLIVERGERLMVGVPGIDQLVNIRLEIYAYGDVDLDGDIRMILYPPPDPIEIPYEDDGATITIQADLPAGQYAISLSAGVPAEPLETTTPNAAAETERGGATYGFAIEVVDPTR